MQPARALRVLFVIAVTVTILAASAMGDAFTSTGTPLNYTRDTHTATLMQNGKVLVAGGYVGATPTKSTELIDLASGNVFGPVNTPNMSVARVYHTATLLQNGMVLLAGGSDGVNTTDKADLYDPITNTITPTGNLKTARFGHTATLLRDGKVLITGGQTPGPIADTAELFDPANGGTFTLLTSKMRSPRHVHSAVLLQNGNVLVIGGYLSPFTATTMVDIFTPGTSAFTAAAPLAVGRFYNSATVLDDGRVFIAGGYGSAITQTTEIYNPSNDTMSAGATLQAARYEHTATLLPNGKVLVTGGYDGTDVAINSTEIFDPAGPIGTTVSSATMGSARAKQTATLLPSGKVLVIAGSGLQTMELYDPGTGTVTSITSLPLTPRSAPTATLLSNGRVLVVGGWYALAVAQAVATSYLYDPPTRTFSPTGSLATGRYRHTATLLANGKVLIAGGQAVPGISEKSAELYDPSTGTFSTTGSMTVGKQGHTATLLADGRVLMAGGYPSEKTTDLYDPVTGTFTAGPDMLAIGGRSEHAAVLLPNGNVLISGGEPTGSMERYVPSSNSFISSGMMSSARQQHTATLFSTKKVLLAGGYRAASQGNADIYDADTGVLETLPMPEFRYQHAALLLGTGNVLLVGGSAVVRLFDTVSHTFQPMGSLTTDTFELGAAMLRDGTVLIAAGDVPPRNVQTNAAYLIDPGLGFSESKRPTVGTAGPICQPASLSLSGAGFTGMSEGSAGSFQSSAANSPMLRLQRMHNDRKEFFVPQAWSATSFLATVDGFPAGLYRLAVMSNGVPSTEQIVEIAPSSPPTLGTYANTSTVNALNTTITPSAPPTYQTTNVNITATPSAGFLGNITINGRTGVITVTDPHPLGNYTVTVSAATACASASRTFTLTVTQIQRPVITATAVSSARVTISWPAVSGAASYELFRSVNVAAPSGAFIHLGSTNTTSYNDINLNPDTTYVYRAQSIDNDFNGSSLSANDLATTTIFADDPLMSGTTVIQALHITEARTAVNAVRVAAGLATYTFTDTSLAGKPVKAVHIQELRTALNDALPIILGSPIAFTNPATANTLVYALDLAEIRSGVK